jgi:signal transduction histidine kinase
MMKRFILITFLASAAYFIQAQDQNIDSLKRQLTTTNKKDYLKTLIELCWEYRFVNADTARKYGLQGLVLAHEMKIDSLEADALNYIGITHEAQGNYVQALEYELKALAIRQEIGNQIKIGRTLNNIGIIYDEMGNYQKSLEYYFEARKIFEQAKDLPKVAMVINNIGIVLKAQREYKKVVGYYHEALTIYKTLQNKFGIAACHANLGSVYLNWGKYDSSLFYSIKAQNEFEVMNNKQFLASTYTNLGKAYYSTGKNVEALQALMRAKSLNEEYDNKKELAAVLIYLANIKRSMHDYSTGIRYASQALTMADKIGARQEMMEATKELALLSAGTKEYRQAFSYYQSYEVLKDSLFEKEKAKQISELQTKYETEKKQVTINLLTKENEFKDIRLRQVFLAITVLALLLLALLTVGLLVRNRNRLKQKASLEAARAELRQQQLQAVIASQEEERKRFAADLHDGLGQMISALRMGLSKENLDQQFIHYSLDLLNSMNVEIRNIAFNLMPQVLMKDGLHEALKEFSQRVTQAGGVYVEAQTYNLSPTMSSEVRIALYRICQEWVNNVIKYSQCKKIMIQAVQHPEELVITIEDDGQGFDRNLLMKGQGNGWKNINSRLSMILGSIEIDSQPDRKGSMLMISIPTEKN